MLMCIYRNQLKSEVLYDGAARPSTSNQFRRPRRTIVRFPRWHSRFWVAAMILRRGLLHAVRLTRKIVAALQQQDDPTERKTGQELACGTACRKAVRSGKPTSSADPARWNCCAWKRYIAKMCETFLTCWWDSGYERNRRDVRPVGSPGSRVLAVAESVSG